VIASQALNSLHSVAVMKRRVRQLARALANAADGDGLVLDVGCGDGTVAQATESLRPGLQFSGVDVFLRPNIAIPAQIYDGETIPHLGGAFDYVTIVDVLHHTDDPARVLGECLRVARRGVIIKDHIQEGFLARPTLRFMDWVGNRGHGVRLPYNYLTRQQWTAVFASVGASPAYWSEQLGLYPAPFNLLFERQLHFVARLERRAAPTP
jgi:SAM-dependent methyltransferase